MLLVLTAWRHHKKSSPWCSAINSLPKRSYLYECLFPSGQNVIALLVVEKDWLLSVCVHVLRLRKGRHERLCATRWTARNPMLLLALPLLLFVANTPAFEPLFE
ncbi:MAG: hypothetical protein QG629_244, partial [Patescibacteria group bacterium]|nr:hypothetical protein [Patescibacteria group bacterium]